MSDEPVVHESTDPAVSQLLSLDAAGRRLGKSRHTMRRWAQSGRIAAVRVRYPQGLRWAFDPGVIAAHPDVTSDHAGEQSTGQSVEQAASTRTAAAVDSTPARAPAQGSEQPLDTLGAALEQGNKHWARLVQDLAHELAEAKAQVGRIEGENRVLYHQLSAATEQIKLLQPPPAMPTEAPESAEQAAVVPRPTAATKRRWWLLWLR